MVVPPGRRASRAPTSATTDPDGSGAAVLAALARLAGARRRRAVRAHRRRRHRQLRQDLDEGPARRRARAAGPDGGPARVVQQRARPALDGPARRRRHPPPRAGVLRPRHGPHRRAVPRSAPPRIGVVLNVGTRAPRRVRLRRGDRAGQGRAGRGAARRTGSRCSTPTTRASPPWRARTAARVRHVRPARGATCAPRTSPSTRAAPGSASSRPRGAAPVALRLVGAHHVGNALAAAAVARRAGRHPGRRGGGAVGRRRPRPGGGWRSPTAPTASPWSTTPTTPTPTRCAPRCAPSPRWAAAGAPGPCSGRWASWAPSRDRARRGRRAAGEGAGRRRARHGRQPRVRGGPPGGRRRTRPPRCCAAELAPGDVVLVKASRAAGLDRVGRRRCLERRRMRGIFIAAGVALAISILLTPYLIRFFARQGFGQEIRDEGPQSHQAKRGTPTMGGVAIMIAIWLGYLALAHGHRRADHARRRCWCCSSRPRWASSASSTTSSSCAAPATSASTRRPSSSARCSPPRSSGSSRCASATPTASRPARTASPSSATSPCSRSGWSASCCWPT